MARLRVYPRKRAIDANTVDYQLRDRRFDPPAEDDRPKVIATERLWWRASRRLAYRAGVEVPKEELPLLVSDTERLGRKGKR